MYVNQIDLLFDSLLDKLYLMLNKKNSFKEFNKDTNFVKYQNNILKLIKEFINNINEKDILNIISKKNNLSIILNIIKRYCAFYIYLGIAYYYPGGRDLYVTNIIESSKYQKDATIQIQNFFNSDNNAKVITFFTNIKDILELKQFKTMDRIKIVLNNAPIKYRSTIELFNELGEDYIIDNFLVKDNFHKILKTLIFRQIYLTEEKNELVKMLSDKEKDDAEYKYIEIIIGAEDKLVDYTVIEKFIASTEYHRRFGDEIYKFLEDNKNIKDVVVRKGKEFVTFLFNNKKIIPITEDILRIHKKTETYGSETDTKSREDTKIKYIMNKVNQVVNMNSEMYKKNPKLKKDAEKYLYKHESHRNAMLYNDNEELNIIQKLEESEQAIDADFLVDLENIRKYTYINYKKMSKDGIKLRTPKTIQAVRLTNITNKKEDPIEIRIGHDNIDLDVVGIILNQSDRKLECYKTTDLVDVRKLIKTENGFEAFIKSMSKNDNNKLFYWLFDTKKDVIKLKEYKNVSSMNVKKNIYTMIEQIYNKYIEIVKNKIENYIKDLQNITFWNLENIIDKYNNKFKIFEQDPLLKNSIISNALNNKMKELDVIDDEVDNLIPGKTTKLIKLPVIDIDNYERNEIVLDDGTEKVVDDDIFDEAICHHHIKWRTIMTMSKKNSEEQNQAIFDFTKQYVKENERSEYICKSCKEVLNLKKYVYEGTYNKEADTFMTTSLAVNTDLYKIPKYSQLTRTIRNMEKNLEKIASSINLDWYLGNMPTNRLRRRLVIKDVIDLIEIHSEYLKAQPKDRMEQYAKKYNIKGSNLFFFPLKDDIFLVSSTDIDKFKIIKFNNVIAYLTLIMISEMNTGQLVGLKNDKMCNFFIYNKLKNQMMGDLYIRMDKKEKIALADIPLLSYTIYYFSCALTNNYIWLWQKNDKNKGYIFSVQKTIINTVVDLLNTLVEANMEENKNFLYEILVTRMKMKIKTVYNDPQILKRIEEESMSKIRIDSKTNKVSYVTKKIKTLELVGEYKETILDDYYSIYCDLKTAKLNSKRHIIKPNKLNLLTNCPDGKFHKWSFDKNDLICSNCKQSYNELLKQLNTTISEKDNMKILEKIKLANLKKLTETYCLSGETHELKDDKCIKCKINPDEYKYKEKELLELEKNLERKKNAFILNNINKMKRNIKKMNEKQENIKIIINKFNKRYDDLTKNKLGNYVSDFVDRMIKILGKKITVDGEEIYLNETIFYIDHDYLGNEIKNPFTISSKDDKIKRENNHKYFKVDIIYYRDNAKKVFVYYNAITKQYLGYSEDNRKFKEQRSSTNIIIKHSIYDMIMKMGLTNEYENIHHIDIRLQKETNENISKLGNILIEKLIRKRVDRLKSILSKARSLLYSVRNHSKNTSNYDTKEKNIINEFTKKLKKFNMRDKEGHNSVFKHLKYINDKSKINEIPENIKINIYKKYLNTNIITNLNNYDSKLIFFLVFNLNRLLDYNKDVGIKSTLTYFIIKIIQYLFNTNYIGISNVELRKFDFLLLLSTPYMDEQFKGLGYFEDVLNMDEIDDEKHKERDYDANEEMNSLDIDDYEKDDDIDYSAEALDFDNT